MNKAIKLGRALKPTDGAGERGAGIRSRNGKPLPSRVAKKRAIERIQRDTLEVRSGTIIPMLRRQGYDEIPLDEIQDRMSKLRDPLAELIVLRRG